jgi:hypothetical protein
MNLRLGVAGSRISVVFPWTSQNPLPRPDFHIYLLLGKVLQKLCIKVPNSSCRVRVSVQCLDVLILGFALFKELGSAKALEIVDREAFSNTIKISLCETHRSNNENFWLGR